MWKNKKSFGREDGEDSWEARAFEEDISGNLLGCTWPPQSYTCVFCLKEFRSPQALGGHMNVHRQDRARLHEVLPTLWPPPPPMLPQATKGREESAAGNGMEMSLLQPFSNTNSFFNHSHHIDFSPSFSISPYLTANVVVEPSDPRTEYATTGEVDLELRLGQSWPPI